MSRDNPGKTADDELTVNYRKDGKTVCGNGVHYVDSPISIEARVVGSKMDYSLTGQTVQIDPINGFICKNDENNPGCKDYELRFCCPGQ